jgi:hypothetical protein
MSVDLGILPISEELVRQIGLRAGGTQGRAIQTILDALNYYRCLALHRDGEIDRLRAAFPDVGFTARDYGDLAKTLRMDADKPYLPAILSNNFNVILGALDAAAIAQQARPQS